jgi:anti-sigma regulatory factor (Ser/Thr protein kinase)
VVSAFGEAFNNVALHSYHRQGGDVEIEIETSPTAMVIRILDYGDSFDIDDVPVPALESLPESGARHLHHAGVHGRDRVQTGPAQRAHHDTAAGAR